VAKFGSACCSEGAARREPSAVLVIRGRHGHGVGDVPDDDPVKVREPAG